MGLDARLVSIPGEAPYLAGKPHIGLSFSHEPGLSLAAINFASPVGIDLLQGSANGLSGDEIRQLGMDYLGPAANPRMDGDPRAFAEAWAGHEARLKCLGLGLTEWTPAVGQGLAGCRCVRLDLPDEWIGVLAVRA